MSKAFLKDGFSHSFSHPLVALLCISSVIAYYGAQWILAAVDPMRAKQKEARKKSSKIFHRLGVIKNHPFILSSFKM
jgi:hypothetical protein